MEKYVIPPFFNLDFKIPALLLLTLMQSLRLWISADGLSDNQQQNAMLLLAPSAASCIEKTAENVPPRQLAGCRSATKTRQPASRSFWAHVRASAGSWGIETVELVLVVVIVSEKREI